MEYRIFTFLVYKNHIYIRVCITNHSDVAKEKLLGFRVGMNIIIIALFYAFLFFEIGLASLPQLTNVTLLDVALGLSLLLC